MTPAAAKLLMCVCAGSTGAVIVPAVHKARAAMHRPAVHRAAVHHASTPGAALAVPCVPIAGGAPGDGGIGGGIGGLPTESGLAMIGGPAANSIGGGFGPGPDYGPGGSVASGDGMFPGGGGGGSVGGGVGGGTPGVPVVTPIAGTVPEPASWAMMIGGFATVGGATRWQRRSAIV
jgi:hypothetical protein